MFKKIILFVVIFASGVDISSAEDIREWDTMEVASEIVYETLSFIDYTQTAWIARHPRTYKDCTTANGGHFTRERENYESFNFILKRHPSINDVRVYFAANALFHPLLAHYVPVALVGMGVSEPTARTVRKTFQGVSIGIQIGSVGNNLAVYGGYQASF